MSRDVPKKIIDKGSATPGPSPRDPEPFRSLDLDDDSEGGGLSNPSLDWESTDSMDDRDGPGKTRSLDALEIPEEGDPGPPVKDWGDEDLHPQEKSGNPKARNPLHGLLGMVGAHRKAIFIACGGLILVLATAVGIRAWYTPPKTALPIVTSVRKPIPIPKFQENLDFFILAAAQSETGMLSLGIEFEFLSPGTHQRFKDDSVLFRDVVYRFLETKRPAKNSQKEWGQVVQNELVEHIRTTLPSSRADTIRLSRFEKL
jgi:hypothetical protein